MRTYTKRQRHEPLPLKWGGLQAGSRGLRIPL